MNESEAEHRQKEKEQRKAAKQINRVRGRILTESLINVSVNLLIICIFLSPIAILVRLYELKKRRDLFKKFPISTTDLNNEFIFRLVDDVTRRIVKYKHYGDKYMDSALYTRLVTLRDKIAENGGLDENDIVHVNSLYRNLSPDK
ncbi:hypothetical protein [Brevibacillus sp. 179-C1.2 HS]|uniref:hypothetical protein n=1 Tax=unclassified Brevibacillus TaxID=2684853 RepID=UPI00399FDBFF